MQDCDNIDKILLCSKDEEAKEINKNIQSDIKNRHLERYLVDPCYENVPKKADHPEKKCEPAPLKRCKFITDQAWTVKKDPKKLSNRCACRNIPPKEACTSCFDSPTPLHAPRLRRNWPDK
ncbi:unnamed protein product [Diamesa tonsa]